MSKQESVSDWMELAKAFDKIESQGNKVQFYEDEIKSKLQIINKLNN